MISTGTPAARALAAALRKVYFSGSTRPKAGMITETEGFVESSVISRQFAVFRERISPWIIADKVRLAAIHSSASADSSKPAFAPTVA
jgi:hypothetical protein